MVLRMCAGQPSQRIGSTDNGRITMTATKTAFDPAKAEAFGGRMMLILGGSLLSSMVDIGHRTGQRPA